MIEFINLESVYNSSACHVDREWYSAVVMCTIEKALPKSLNSFARNCVLRAILNKSWRQHPTRHQLYGHLPPITKTIQVRRTRHAGHCWRSRDELISDVLLWTPTHGLAKAGRPARTYIQQLCEDTGCCPEDLPGAMNDREEWRERVRDIRATSATWWWWWSNIIVLRILNLEKRSCKNQILRVTLPPRPPDTSTSSNHFTSWPVII